MVKKLVTKVAAHGQFMLVDARSIAESVWLGNGIDDPYAAGSPLGYCEL